MSNNNENKKIKLTDEEFDKISKLYQTALEASSQTTLSSGGSSLGGDAFHKHEAWHNVQEYMNELGKKYGYDPEKYVINKYTKELERYSFEHK
ncbi:MAG: hypothetical protein H0X03_05450 [Nitrosopumilus sp.]|nr:hypothetical protein [Nitrosopumilus sp.]